jgi:hypothetical protein
MYRRPKFLEVLLQIREQMARDADYDVDRFAEMVRSGSYLNGSAGLSLTDHTSKVDESEPEVRFTSRHRTAKRRS